MGDQSLRLQSFINGEYNLDVVLQNNEPLFFGKEVAEMLGFANTKDAIIRHVDPEDKVEFQDLQGGRVSRPPCQPHKILIKEPGLYSLVFQSQLPQAKKFKRWVFREVLPQIRRTGRFSLNDGLLKIRDICEEEVTKMSESEKKEFKLELKRFSELLKNPAQQERGRKGASAFWRNYREKEILLGKYKLKLETVQLLVEDLKGNLEEYFEAQ